MTDCYGLFIASDVEESGSDREGKLGEDSGDGERRRERRGSRPEAVDWA